MTTTDDLKTLNPAATFGPWQEFMANNFFGSLNGIRAIAILAVLWHHVDRGSPSTVLLMLNHGHLGVDMFFIMSGFLIVTLLVRERDRSGDISLPKFYSRRSLRIFPLYYAILGLLTVAFLVKSGANKADDFFESLPFLATYTGNWVELSFFSVAWSLAAEEQFYLIWPVVEKFLAKTWGVIAGVVIGLGFVLSMEPVRNIIEDSWFSPVSYMWQIAAMPIVIGAVVAHLLNNEKAFRAIHRYVTHRWSPVIGLVAVLAAASLPSDEPSVMVGFPRLAVYAAMTYFLLSCVVVENHSMKGILASKPMARIGIVSYGIYLIHILVVPYIGNLLSPIGQEALAEIPVVSLVGTLIVSWALAEVSFRLFEQPILSFRKYFSVTR